MRDLLQTSEPFDSCSSAEAPTICSSWYTLNHTVPSPFQFVAVLPDGTLATCASSGMACRMALPSGLTFLGRRCDMVPGSKERLNGLPEVRQVQGCNISQRADVEMSCFLIAYCLDLLAADEPFGYCMTLLHSVEVQLERRQVVSYERGVHLVNILDKCISNFCSSFVSSCIQMGLG